MIEATFNLVMGSGHCGSMWFARALDAQLNVHATHELRMRSTKLAWQRAHQFAPADAVHAPYWKAVELSRTWGLEYWDVNSWMPWELERVEQCAEVTRICYLVRDGIKQLESLRRFSSWKTISDYTWHGHFWLLNFWQAVEWERMQRANPACKTLKHFEEMSVFEKQCLLIAGNLAWPRWLRHDGVSVQVVRLEDLVSDWRHLANFVNMGHTELRRLQALDVNRHNQHERDSLSIWNSWSEEEQLVFKDICGPFMSEYGYGQYKPLVKQDGDVSPG